MGTYINNPEQLYQTNVSLCLHVPCLDILHFSGRSGSMTICIFISSHRMHIARTFGIHAFMPLWHACKPHVLVNGFIAFVEKDIE